MAPTVTPPHICFDVPPPPGPAMPPGVQSIMALQTSKLWPPTRDQSRIPLRVRFLGGDATTQARVLACMKTLEATANLAFSQVGPSIVSEMRIAFNTASGSWSNIGTDCLTVPQDTPTMNLGWVNASTDQATLDAVVLHETLHALGAVHEHQSPAAIIIHWNPQKVYAAYGGPPNYWSRAMIDSNVLSVYGQAGIDNTIFDPESIMLYPIDPALTLDGFGTKWNTQLSAVDRSFLFGHYPVLGQPPPPPPKPPILPPMVDLPIGSTGVVGTFPASPANVPVYQMVIPKTGRWKISCAPASQIVFHRASYPSPIRRAMSVPAKGAVLDLRDGLMFLEVHIARSPQRGHPFRLTARGA